MKGQPYFRLRVGDFRILFDRDGAVILVVKIDNRGQVSNVKERLLGAITVMNEEEAMRLWEFVLELSGNGWDAIEEVEPDEIDLQLIREAQSDPDCQVFD